ncbi:MULTISPECIES: FtsB family cell division protein [Virgibacillus]|uniref:Cell division protein n=1 Tax=Virgibacillus pantothenticus TaxID=1473 RepID=A0A0L0QR18_VIRPA|nr:MULTISPECIES: septum formation initiator family protein [Virgibacillus]API92326.1 cell division protein [Virgibacillus sp. 6R]KNE21065.1 cell division protein [Virgibacillus pantothenticus]MBS7427074.1 septum formation initiator family protein [Virgibacillus sp. 19R1-5]MBU8568135.1 septum formation initiator family protein [Virgibacillus pantothenticus]MBU8602147.1 septum formation initiator family protein [Virgibacillus pantothenticus]
MAASKRTVTKLDSNYMQQYDAYVERQKRKKQRLIRRLVLFSVIALIAIGSMTTYHMKQRSLHAEKTAEYESLQEELANLKEEQSSLKEEAERLKNEDYVLEIARTNYFLSKEGELIFKLPDKEPSY